MSSVPLACLGFRLGRSWACYSKCLGTRLLLLGESPPTFSGAGGRAVLGRGMRKPSLRLWRASLRCTLPQQVVGMASSIPGVRMLVSPGRFHADTSFHTDSLARFGCHITHARRGTARLPETPPINSPFCPFAPLPPHEVKLTT